MILKKKSYLIDNICKIKNTSVGNYPVKIKGEPSEYDSILGKRKRDEDDNDDKVVKKKKK